MKKAIWTKAFPEQASKPKPKKRLRRVSKKKAKDLLAYASLRKEFLKRFPICFRCKIKDATEIHHVRGRLHHLLLDARFFRGLCSACHHFTHTNIEAARKEGLIAEKGKWNEFVS